MLGGWRRPWLRSLVELLARKGPNSKRRAAPFRPLLEHLENRTTPSTLSLTTSADNTLYQVSTSDPMAQLSNGAGPNFFVGDTNQPLNNIRRGAIKFDLSSIPVGSTVTSATLTLHVSKLVSTGAENVTLNRALLNWGEGTSTTGSGGGGAGVPATTNDVTWYYTFYSSQLWTTPGGDFAATASATTAVNGLGFFNWTGPGVVSDLQQWVNNPTGNFGWIVLGNESAAGTALQLDTKENTTAADRPLLTVNYTPPVTPTQLVITSAPTMATAGAPFMITVNAEDGSGNLATTDNGAITLNSSAGADLSPTTVSLTNGTATIPVTLTAAGSQTISASATGLTSGTATLSVSLGPFTGYNVGVIGSSTIQAGSNFLGTVQAADAFGNPITSYTGPASVTVNASPSSAVGDFPATVAINAQGLGFFLGNLQKVGSYALTATSGSFSGNSSPLTIIPGSAVKIGFGAQPVSTPAGVTLPPVTVQILDAFGNVVTGDNSDAVTISIATGPGAFLAGSSTTVTAHSGVATFGNLTLVKPGSYTLSELVPSLYTGPNSTSFSVVPLQVLPGSFAAGPTGFSLSFNAPFLVNSVTPVLYGQGFGPSAPVPTVTLTGPSGPVEGSLIVSTATNSLTFVETDTASEVNNSTPILPDGTYTVDITSSAATDGLQALNAGGGFLDGTNSGTAGHDFTTTFTIDAAASGDDVLWLPATADGPGQPLEAPGNNQVGGGYPLYLDTALFSPLVTDVQATLSYNPALLTVTPTSTPTFTVTVPTPGTATLHYHGVGLNGMQVNLGAITATVPGGTAVSPTPYRAKDLLHLSGATVNGSSGRVATADGLHLVAYVGDGDGNGNYSSNDAVLITRVGLQTDSGFVAYPQVDPVIVADTDGSGFIPADAPLQVNEAGVGFATSNLPNPPIPTGVVFQPVPNNVDPSVSIPAGLQVGTDGVLTVPVNIDDAHPAGSTGLIEAHLALRYDPSQFIVSAADIHLGSVLSAGIGWSLTATINPVTGEIAITLTSTTPISSTVGGSLVTIDFYPVGANADPSSIVLASSINPTGTQVIRTELEDRQGTFTLSPTAEGVG
jgi:hypothetical protein